MKRYHQSHVQDFLNRVEEIDRMILSDLTAVLEKHVGDKSTNYEVWTIFEREIGLLSSRWAYYLAAQDQI